MNNMKDNISNIDKIKFIAVVVLLPVCIVVLAWVVVALIAG